MQAAADGPVDEAARPAPVGPDGTLPATDTERDAVLRLLTRQVGEGRLDLAGFDERSRIAVQARTRGELAAALRGLPPPGTFARAPIDASMGSASMGSVSMGSVSMGSASMGSAAFGSGSIEVPPPAARAAAGRLAPPSADRGWAMLGHLLGWVTSAIGPLILLATRGRESAYVRRQAAEAANFQITVLLAIVGLAVVAALTFGLGALLYLPLTVAWLVLPLIATVAAACGDPYRYPWILRLVR